MNPRLQLVFRDDDGMRQAILTGPAAGDQVFVDLATGALHMAEAVAQEALRRGFKFVVGIDALGAMRFADPHSERRFREATEVPSTDPAKGNAPSRPIKGQAQESAPAAADERNAQAAAEGADALMAAIGRVERAQKRYDEQFFIHFTDLSSLLSPGTVVSQRARHVFGTVGRLLSAGHGHPSSRLVVTVASDVQADAQDLLKAHDHGATPWQIAEIPLPTIDEIEQFLGRAKDRAGLSGNVRATATMLAQRAYTLTRISETLRRKIKDGEKDISSIIGGEMDPAKLADAQRRLDAMVGLDEVKLAFSKLVKELAAIQEALKIGQITEPTSTHMALLGRPGTGKTEVARIIASLLHAAGIRRRDVCIRATSADIVGEYNSGQAIQNIRRLMRDAADGVLFIDEAYTLAENEWGRQAIDVLIAEMEERRGALTVILAGYEDRMQRLFEANEGLKSRLTRVFRLPDYTQPELCEILDRRLKSTAVEATAEARDAAHAIVRREATRRHGNARDVRNLFEQWNRERLVSGARRLDLSHVTDPRSPSRANAEHLIAEYGGAFKGLPEFEQWMRDAMLTSFDALGHGRLPRAPRLVFAGPPGTGKTETARRVGRFLRACGVLRDGRLIETSLKDFTSQFVGGSSERTERQFRDAAECVLFIDEIYTFVGDAQGRSVLDQIVAALTNPEYDNMAVIIAGYEDRMPDVYRANGGLKDRFDKTIRFAWPDNATLASITLDALARRHGRTASSAEAASVAKSIERTIASRRSLPDFAGARSALLISEEINTRYVLRGGSGPLTATDVPNPPPSDQISKIVDEYRAEYPHSDSAGASLRNILAEIKLHEREGPGATAALGLCLMGGPGSGKSTFARWLMRRVAERPGMSPAPIVDCSAQSLQGSHLGEAQQNVRGVFERARGGWLFIDEFHALHSQGDARQNLFSVEIAKEVVAQMTAPQNIGTKVLLAGYPTHMRDALAMDPGLTSRFNRQFMLDAPGDEALAQTAYWLLRRKHGGTGDVGYETLGEMFTRHFARRRSREMDSFAGYRAADELAQTAARNAMLRADGDVSSFRIEIDDILAALTA